MQYGLSRRGDASTRPELPRALAPTSAHESSAEGRGLQCGRRHARDLLHLRQGRGGRRADGGRRHVHRRPRLRRRRLAQRLRLRSGQRHVPRVLHAGRRGVVPLEVMMAARWSARRRTRCTSLSHTSPAHCAADGPGLLDRRLLLVVSDHAARRLWQRAPPRVARRLHRLLARRGAAGEAPPPRRRSSGSPRRCATSSTARTPPSTSSSARARTSCRSRSAACR